MKIKNKYIEIKELLPGRPAICGSVYFNDGEIWEVNCDIFLNMHWVNVIGVFDKTKKRKHLVYLSEIRVMFKAVVNELDNHIKDCLEKCITPVDKEKFNWEKLRSN